MIVPKRGAKRSKRISPSQIVPGCKKPASFFDREAKAGRVHHFIYTFVFRSRVAVNVVLLIRRY